MLHTLHISNYALIDKVDIEFTEGLNIVTGETGAGKSIILGALSLILGARADSKVLGGRDRKTVIEAEFRALDEYPELKHFCLANDVDWDDEQCILRREIAPNGRSRTFVNDSPVTVSLLEEIGERLVDIHSQHRNRLLQSELFQLEVVDRMAHNESLLEEYAVAYKQMRLARKELDDAIAAVEKNRADEEYMRYRLQQIDDVVPQPDEQIQLERDRELLANMTEVKSALNAAVYALSDSSDNVLSQLDIAVTQCDNLASVLEDAESLARRLESARIEIQDIAETLADYDSNLTADPQELQSIEERLSELYGLQRRFNVDSNNELIAIREDLCARLGLLDNADDSVAELKAVLSQRKKELSDVASRLSAARREAADELSRQLKERAMPLGMRNLQCSIKLESIEPSITGADRVEFLFAFNKNQPLLPVGGAASGGEISRLMLSIKSIVAEKMQLPSIIFDEIDTGVSGDVASRMGKMMKQMSHHIQVIAISHLPQVAALGDTQFRVFKEDNDDMTLTHICRLSEEERVRQIASLLSGSEINEAAVANAKALLAARDK